MKANYIILTALLAFFAISCGDNAITNPVVENNTIKQLEFEIYGADYKQIVPASLDNDMKIVYGSTEKFDMTGFFANLTLSKSNRKIINEYLAQHNSKAKEIYAEYQIEQSIIIERANYARSVIIDDYRNFHISYQEALSQIESLNRGVEELFKQGALQNKYIGSILKDRVNMVMNIGQILDHKQLNEWSRFTRDNYKVFFGLPL